MNKNLFRIYVLLFIFSINGYSQPAIQWQRTIGGNFAEELEAVRQTYDNGFILSGHSTSNISANKTENCRGRYDYWIVKTDSLGNVEWDKTFGGDLDDELFALDLCVDSGFVVAGRSLSEISGDKTGYSRGDFDYWIIKLSSSGIIQWQRTYGGNGGDQLFCLRQTHDGGYLVGGYSNSGYTVEHPFISFTTDFWLLKLDSAGDIQWQKSIGGSAQDFLYSLDATTDGGSIIGGYSYSNASGDKTDNNWGDSDFWILKLSFTGQIQWQKTIGGTSIDQLTKIFQTSDGGYIAAGYSWSDVSGLKTENSRGRDDYWIVKLNAQGNIQWQKTIGGDSNDIIFDIKEMTNGTFIAGGYSTSGISGDKTEAGKGYEDYWLVKLSATGQLLWEKTIGGNGDDELWSLDITRDGGYILAGTSLSGISGDKTDDQYGAIGYGDYWILKMERDTTTSVEEIENDNIYSLYPNPVTSSLSFSFKTQAKRDISIVDETGRMLMSFQSNSITQSIDLSNYSAGIYFLLIREDENRNIYSKKIVIL